MSSMSDRQVKIAVADMEARGAKVEYYESPLDGKRKPIIDTNLPARMTVNVTEADSLAAAGNDCDDHNCGLAQGISHIRGVLASSVGPVVIMIEHGNRVESWRHTSKSKRAMQKFDGVEGVRYYFPPGKYELRRPSPSEQRGPKIKQGTNNRGKNKRNTSLDRLKSGEAHTPKRHVSMPAPTRASLEAPKSGSVGEGTAA